MEILRPECDAAWMKHAYEMMVRIRKFEEMAAQAFTRSELSGNIHLSLGQEASAVGTSLALEKTDYITTTHRGHGHCIAKGARTDKMLAELFGKETGYCHGRTPTWAFWVQTALLAPEFRWQPAVRMHRNCGETTPSPLRTSVTARRTRGPSMSL